MNPLDQLAPLISPDPISWWPPAPGWWLLGLVLLMALGLLWRLRHRLLRRKPHVQPEPPL
ncbi:MAG TPA: DUF4381 domain-containing protein, partial [Pseudomonas sp.]|nr:DUF4381 domain-containing protein [Pseudomonas sp.]